ncbi:MBL fold metallo-hydrolase [Streptomyces hoynatensis]|uniref:MBL fold metallo-hydrolase n=1 Tax=Streptomyces hoynatensis TaxID=1141874 RepID=A0A3A9ZEB9_9ACTN|nr:MBL fold metallo-hydrolase [Streptomyces hoynatensis]RKN45646.1 MBL fold metallo-hydrolase [Streptomyces hoynatensis]
MPEWERKWEELRPGVLRTRLPGWDETVGAVALADGVLLVDAGPSLPAGARAGREAAHLLGLPVTRLVVTHPHFDHALGAGAFPDAERFGPSGLAGADLARDLAGDAVRHGLDAAQARRAAGALGRGGPWREVAGELRLGTGSAPGRVGEVLLHDLGPAHSPRDVAVLVPGTPPVLFCGDLVEESGEPQAGPDAEPARWPAALGRLLALGGPEARYVPGHGAVVDAAFVEAQRRTLAARFGTPGAAEG